MRRKPPNSSASSGNAASNHCCSAGSICCRQASGATIRLPPKDIHILTPIESLENPDFRRAAELLLKAQVTPDMVALSNFAAVQTWAEAVRRAGSGDPNAVVAQLRSGTFNTAVGHVAFDEKGDRRDIRYSILTWKDGLPVASLPWRP